MPWHWALGPGGCQEAANIPYTGGVWGGGDPQETRFQAPLQNSLKCVRIRSMAQFGLIINKDDPTVSWQPLGCVPGTQRIVLFLFQIAVISSIIYPYSPLESLEGSTSCGVAARQIALVSESTSI